MTFTKRRPTSVPIDRHQPSYSDKRASRNLRLFPLVVLLALVCADAPLAGWLLRTLFSRTLPSSGATALGNVRALALSGCVASFVALATSGGRQ